MRRYSLILFALAAAVSWSNSARGEGCNCPLCGHGCQQSQLVEKTIMVPMCITETRLETCIEFEEEEREQTYTVFKRVKQEPRKYYTKYCYIEDEVKTIPVSRKQCVLIDNPVLIEYVTQVPVKSYKECTRSCCRPDGTICIENFQVCETRLIEQMQSMTCKKKDVVFAETISQCSYCVKTPHFKKKLCKIETEYKLEPVTKTRKVCGCFPKVVKKPRDVQVIKMVPKKILCCERCSSECGK